ncbi:MULTISPECIES: hypothetical protein [unclassified Mesorhizobium]|uniref:hypothetical protein n=1 Tax=unclassified Mesorhizobium TaxID=325217 RepID=UPI0013E2D25D|nr:MULTISPECIES: hypothetical protein [unclassified Mesorhizobium]
MQKIIRALVLVYAFCVSDGATPQAAPLAVDGSPALIVSHPGAVASLIELAAVSAQ